MASAAKVLRYAGFTMTILFAVVIGSFIVGDAMTDPGGPAGVLLTAAWFVPMIGLAGYALWRPRQATRPLIAIAALTALVGLIDELTTGVQPHDRIGPVGAIAGFAVAVAVGALGLRRPWPAGWLLLGIGTANLVGVAVNALGSRGGLPLRAALTGSTGAVAVPMLIAGGTYLIAAALERSPKPARSSP